MRLDRSRPKKCAANRTRGSWSTSWPRARELLEVMVQVYLSGGGLGLVPVILLIGMLIEGVLAVRAVRALGSGAGT